MGSDWIELTLGEITSWSSGGTPSKSNDEYWQGDIPWISARSMNGNRYNYSDLNITTSGLKQGSRLANKDSILLLVRGSILHQKIQVGIATRDVAFNQDVKALKVNKDIIEPWYLLFWFISKKQDLLALVENTGIGAGKLDTKILQRLPVQIPPKNERERILEFSKAIDDKIELNRQMNETLESMAQVLFKSWFVDFDPVIDNALAAGNAIPDVFAERAAQRKAMNKDKVTNPLFPDAFEYTEEMGWIPQGWESVKLDTLLEVKYGKDHKKLDEGSIPVYGSGGLMRLVNKSLYTGESILIPRKGTLSNIMFVDEEFWSVDTMFFTIPKIPHAAKYLFQQLKMLDFSSMNVGSAVPSMTTKVLNDLNILKPSPDALEEFDRLATDLFNKEKALTQQSDSLAKLRDTLLPKLLSGELRIPDAEKLVEEAQND